MYNGNYKVASLVYIYNVYVCSKTIFSPVVKIAIPIFHECHVRLFYAFHIFGSRCLTKYFNAIVKALIA